MKSKFIKFVSAALASVVLLTFAAGKSAVLSVRPEEVTICHATGLEGTTHFVTLTLPYVAVYGQAGPLNEG